MGFLDSTIKVYETEVRLEDILIVKEFSDVFPNDLPGLPPNRDIEFSIDLGPGICPISKAPYSMTPAELKELKEQLQEFLEKGLYSTHCVPMGSTSTIC